MNRFWLILRDEADLFVMSSRLAADPSLPRRGRRRHREREPFDLRSCGVDETARPFPMSNLLARSYLY
jgi:hypothetical protein